MARSVTVELAPGVWRIPLIRDFVNGFMFRDDDGQVTLVDMGVAKSGPKVITALRSIGWEALQAHERELGERFLAGLPERYALYGPPSMEGRVPTFAINHPSLRPQAVAAALAERGLAVWPGNYYAVEVMERLGLPEGAVRIGFVHYNTTAELERLLAALDAL